MCHGQFQLGRDFLREPILGHQGDSVHLLATRRYRRSGRMSAVFHRHQRNHLQLQLPDHGHCCRRRNHSFAEPELRHLLQEGGEPLRHLFHSGHHRRGSGLIRNLVSCCINDDDRARFFTYFVNLVLPPPVKLPPNPRLELTV